MFSKLMDSYYRRMDRYYASGYAIDARPVIEIPKSQMKY